MRRLALGFAFALAASAALAQTQMLSIATGNASGVYYPLGGGLAQLLTKYAGFQATAEVTGGSVDNLKLVGAKKDYLAFTMADASLEAARGEDKFKGQPVAHKALAVLYPNVMHVVTVEGTGITTLADLKGKRVSTGSQGSATEVMAFRVLEAAGLDKDKDVKRERLSVAESTNAIKDKKIDAYFWVGGLPTAGVTDLAASPGLKLKLIDTSGTVEKMNAKHGPLYAATKIPAGTYPGQDKDAPAASVWNILVAHDTMGEAAAYAITKVMFEKTAEWATVHKEAANVKLENQKQAHAPVPFHAGALKYFAERGIKVN
jgi:uncharacterized protein